MFVKSLIPFIFTAAAYMYAVSPSDISDDSKVFSDNTGTELRSGITKDEIGKMKIPVIREFAEKLFGKKYSPDKLSAKYEACLDPEVLSGKMRIGSGFSKYEGITGIVLDKGPNIVFADKIKGAQIKLLVPDWNRKPPAGIKPEDDPDGWGLFKEEFVLKEGLNYIELEKGGNVYIQYFTQTPEDSQPVTVHFPTGKFNGYFDITRGDTNADFDKLLENAVSPVLDMRGQYIQVAFPVDSLKVFTKGRGAELIKNFDRILYLQRKMLGWEKEGYKPENHVLARINYNYYMFRDEDGVAYIDWAMKLVADPESVIKGDPCWGFSHEAGHVHQMTQMTWGGMTEVSNNILTMYCTTTLGNRSRLFEESVYAKARETILDKGISYMDFPGKAPDSTDQYGGDGNTDVFQRLVPFWQLYLYFRSQGYEDFYPDLMIALRKREQPGTDYPLKKDYLNMLEFCRLACEVSKTDLTEFFERWGFFYTGEIDVNDYEKYLYYITTEEITAVKKAISDMKLKKPVKDITAFED